MNLYRKAMSGDNTCMLFWLKCRANWREVSRFEHTGADGQPFDPTPIIVRFTEASKEDEDREGNETVG